MFRQLTALLLAALIAVPCCCCAFASSAEKSPQKTTCCGLPLQADQDQQPSDNHPCDCQENLADRDAPGTAAPSTDTTWLLLTTTTWPSLELPAPSGTFSQDHRHQAPPPPPVIGRHLRTLLASFLV